jgi:hypothetical protein
MLGDAMAGMLGADHLEQKFVHDGRIQDLHSQLPTSLRQLCLGLKSTMHHSNRLALPDFTPFHYGLILLGLREGATCARWGLPK